MGIVRFASYLPLSSKNITSAASINAKPSSFATILPLRYSPLDADKIEAYMLKIIFERHIEPESGNYIIVAVLYLLEYLFKIAASRCGIVAGVEHIGNFCISAETLAGRRRHDIAAVGI